MIVTFVCWSLLAVGLLSDWRDRPETYRPTRRQIRAWRRDRLVLPR